MSRKRGNDKETIANTKQKVCVGKKDDMILISVDNEQKFVRTCASVQCDWEYCVSNMHNFVRLVIATSL